MNRMRKGIPALAVIALLLSMVLAPLIASTACALPATMEQVIATTSTTESEAITLGMSPIGGADLSSSELVLSSTDTSSQQRTTICHTLDLSGSERLNI